MSEPDLDAQAVLADLKDFQRRTALWAFERLFAEGDPAVRFLVADEVGLGKTHVAKGVIALVIEHLRRIGDERHDIVYVCSNAVFASVGAANPTLTVSALAVRLAEHLARNHR